MKPQWTTIIGFSTLALWIAAAASGCSEKEEDFSSPNKKKKKDNEPVEEVYKENRAVEGVESYQGVKGSGFLVKNYLQLKASAKACLGSDLGIIEDSMFTAGACSENADGSATASPQAEDQKAILGKDKCGSRGENVYDVLKNKLWAPELAGRTDTLSNQLTSSYLQALAVAADVYAHGVNNPERLCESEDEAQELLGRCLPQYSPKQRQAAVEAIHSLCEQGGVKAREALATILGSAAFAATSARESEED